MSANVISYPSVRRKRASARAWTARRIGLLLATAAGLIAASWLAPDAERPAPPPAATIPRIAQPAPPPSLAIPEAVDIANPRRDSARRPARRRTARPTSVPLDAAGAEPAGYEILNAAELEAISQADE